MNPLYLAATASFIAGMCGYIIVRFWLIPIRRYKKVKQTLKSELKKIGNDKQSNRNAGNNEKDTAAIRRQAMQLVDVHRYDLPYWYRLVLIRRNESPENALAAVLKMSKSAGETFRQHLADVRKHLGMR